MALARAAMGDREEEEEVAAALAMSAGFGGGIALPGADDPFWEPVAVPKRKSPLAPAVLGKLVKVRDAAATSLMQPCCFVFGLALRWMTPRDATRDTTRVN